MTEDYVIREFEQNDIESVVAINRSCLPENYPDHFFMGLHYHAPQAFLIALDPEHIFGYIMCRIERGISTFGKMPVKKGHIVSVAVLHEIRHKGIGTALIKAGMKGVQSYGASEIFLEVRKTNEEAISVYEKLDFDIKRVLKGYYRDGEDAYLMALKFPPASEEELIE